MEKYGSSEMAEKFGQVLGLQRAKNTQKVPSLPLFCHIGSSLGKINFWRGKWTPNL